jgi:hypothetical protein
MILNYISKWVRQLAIAMTALHMLCIDSTLKVCELE